MAVDGISTSGVRTDVATKYVLACGTSQHARVIAGTAAKALAFPPRTERATEHAFVILSSAHHLDGHGGGCAGRNVRSRQSWSAHIAAKLDGIHCAGTPALRGRARHFVDLYLTEQPLHVFFATKLSAWRKYGR